MSLTQDDLQKIKAVVDARADLQDAKIERLRSEMATKQDLQDLEERLTGKIDGVRAMLEEDHRAVVEDVAILKSQVAELQAK